MPADFDPVKIMVEDRYVGLQLPVEPVKTSSNYASSLKAGLKGQERKGLIRFSGLTA